MNRATTALLVLLAPLAACARIPAAAPAPAMKAAPAAASGVYASVDARAFAAPEGMARNPATLARYLVAGARSDREKARAIYTWVAGHIAYDLDAVGRPRATPITAAEVLATRRSICEGYTTLFQTLASLAGLDAVTISGYAKGTFFTPGQPLDQRSRHTWNAVRIDGAWRQLDVTWGAGFIRNGRFVRAFRGFYFLPPRGALAFTHFADDPAWRAAGAPASLAAFTRMPVARTSLFEEGVDPEAALRAARAPGFSGFVTAFAYAGRRILVRRAPLGRALAAGRAERFAVEVPDADRVALIDAAGWHYVAAADGVYAASVAPPAGTLRLMARFPGDSRFWPILEYAVE